ncbi:MAG TPA: protein kinase [Thermoanaerobaculia bacterium]|nr:protein kinase [Thermoanaerobaculia bacterium]
MALVARTLLGRYEVLAPLGAGGMGEVYRARDLRLGREVAVKILPEHLSGDPIALIRFEREARAVAALSHPNLLAIYDFGADGGVNFAVTELLRGETLRGALSAGAMPWRRAVEVGAALADGLAAAHSRGIVHRDLKPANIFLTEEGRVKILDFGLARWVQNPADGEPNSAPTTPDPTRPGTVLGTVGYMSPEQVRGETTTGSSDLFAFGCVLHEMLTGRATFPGSTALERMAAILRDEPPPPSRLAPDVPPDLDRVVASCLEKSPSRRPSSAEELAASLRGLLSVVGTDSTVAASGARAAAPKRGSRTKSLAILPFINPAADPEMDYLSEGITESLINGLSQLRKLRVMARSTMFRYRGDADPQQVGRELGVGTVLSGRVASRPGVLSISAELVDASNGWRLWGARYDRPPADLLAVQEEIAREITSNLKLTLEPEQKKRLARRYEANREAYPLYLKGRYHWNKGTVAGFQKAMELFHEAIEKDPAYALAWAGVSDCYAMLGMDRYAALPPREAYPKAKAAARKALEIDDTLAEGHTSLAYALLISWEFAAAEEEFRRAIQLNPGYAQAHHFYGFLLSARGRDDESLAQFRQALEADPLSLIINADYGWAFYCAHRYPEAVEQLQKTIDMDARFPQSYLWLGLAHQASGQFERSIAAFDEGVRLTNGNPTFVAGRGVTLVAAGRRSEAEAILADFEERAKTQYVPMASMVQMNIALGHIDRAFEWLEKAADYRASFMLPIRVYPFFDPIRSDPRFSRLLETHGLA